MDGGTERRLGDEPSFVSERRLVSEWEAIIKNNDGEAETHTLHKYIHTPSEVFPPAVPARISPSRRKPIERDHNTIFVFGDAQIDYRRVYDHDTGKEELVPIHDERALKLARFVCRDLRPDVIVNLGDTVDLASLSRFKPDSDHFHRTLGPSFQRIHDYYAELRADNPDARIVEVDSNHHKRLKDFVLKNMPQLYNMRRAGEQGYPVMSYPYLANLDHVGVEWVGGYGSAMFEYADDLAFMHGTMALNTGSTAYRLSKENPDRNIVQGHAHRMETAYRTTRFGKQLGAFVVGALCRTDGLVPSYRSAVDDMGAPVKQQENWQQGAMVVIDHGDGMYQFDHVPFHNGRAFYNGKEYNVNE